MKEEDIHLYDWQRILVGDVPGIFYVEILIRAAAIYLLLVLSMRFMGRRMASKLSRNEMAAMVSMAAAIGVPILDAHRGLLPAYVIGLVVVLTQRIVSYYAAKNQRFEAISQGDRSTLVENSVIQLANMKDARITRELLFAQLRSGGLFHLGSVKRLYMEANGAFTLVEDPKPRPGLSILPEWDTEFIDQQEKASGQNVCHHCGNQQPESSNKTDACSNCDYTEWVPALK
ncbi:DUF421 domain-containing protein [Spirosoma validum]|uniref:DUF421 domain-containing protein n=1 Tax=Spirosoma validum TaxID=2771355 RepID=A0A927B7F5_9BACT|nr:YetF domain-containing protein [Spirosoma validum]MBD2756764.1 DUF421 domain-containing protein [Spirosoma validum]